jgi:hypothetical protein
MGCNASSTVVTTGPGGEPVETPGKPTKSQPIATPPLITPKKSLTLAFELEDIQSRYSSETLQIFSFVTAANWGEMKQLANPPAEVKSLMEIVSAIAPSPGKLGWGAALHFLNNPTPVEIRLSNICLADIDKKVVSNAKSLYKSTSSALKPFEDKTHNLMACVQLFSWLAAWQKYLEQIEQTRKTYDEW